jgi:Sulfotransferase family
MDGKVQVQEVLQLGRQNDLVRESAIERPAVGREARAAPGGWSLDVRGWAVGGPAPVAQVELSAHGVVIRRVRCDAARPALATERPDLPGAGSSGFYATISALDLPRRFELRLDALLADGGRSTIGVIRGSRAALRTPFTPRMQPLMVTGPGRTGSTIFMQMLAAHPGIAVHPPFEGEPRIMTYWIDVARALARPQSWMRQITPVGPPTVDWWLGHADNAPRRLRSRPLQAWLAEQAVEELAAFAQSRIEATYACLEAAEGKTGAGYFAEKVVNGIVSDVVWELYPGTREVVLVRDPRDVLTSFLAFRKLGKRPMPEDPVRWVEEKFAGRILIVLESMRRHGEHTHLVRYEDLMARPRETLAGVLEYLGLGSQDETIGSMLETAGQQVPGMKEHRTTPDPAVSIGRWRRDLPPELVEACEQAVGPALEAWGYTWESPERSATS